MVYGVQGQLVLASARRRDQALSSIEKALSGKKPWGTGQVAASSPGYRVAGYGLAADVRFESESDADDVFAKLVGAIDRIAEPGSWVTLHACTHDGTGGGCAVTNRKDW